MDLPWTSTLDGLPLQRGTDPAWAERAVADVDALLTDHAHCEQKAASSALALIGRHPDSPGLARAMISLAHEELKHFRQVVDRIEARGGALGHPGPDPYAAEVRRLSCTLPRGLGGLGDLLVASAFIEARSCERFRLLAEHLHGREGEHGELGAFYAGLAEAEGRHWELFRDLAVAARNEPDVARRIAVIGDAEADLVARLPLESRIH